MEIFSLFGSVVLKDNGVTSGLDKIDKKASDTDKSTTSHFKNMANASKVVGQALGAVGLIAGTFLVSAVESASKAGASTEALKQKLENQGIAWSKAKVGVDEFTKGVTKMSVYSGGQAKEALDNLITKHVSLSSALKDQAGMTELASAKHITLKESSDIIADAENGRMKGLVKLGIVTADEVKKGISMEEINKRLNTSYKGVSEGAMKTLPGQITVIGNNFNALKVGIGNVLLPVITKFATKLGDLSTYLANVSPEAKKIIAIVLSATTVIGLLAGGVSIVSKVMSVLGPVVGGLGSLIGGLSLPIVAIIAGIALLTTAFINNWGGIRTKTEEFIAFIKPILIDTFNNIVAWFKSNLPAMKKAFEDVMAGMKIAYDIYVKPLLVIIVDALKTVIDWVVLHMPEIKATFEAVFKGITTVYNSILKPVMAFMLAILKQVVDWVVANWPLIKQTISTILTAVWNVTKSVLNTIKDFWNTWGKSIMDLVSTTFNVIKDVISTAIKVVQNVLKAVMQIITGDWKGAWKSIVQACKDLFGGIDKVVGDILSGIGKQFKDFISVALGFGKDIIGGIIDGISAKAKELAKGVGDIIQDVKDAFTKGFSIHSPSKYFQWIGGHLMGGLIKGMSLSNVKDFASGLVESIKASFGDLGGSVSGDLAGWLTTAMGITGTSMSDYGMLMKLIMSESGGNPNAINLTDSNAQAGHPSQGLMQTIPTTFERWRNKSLSDNIVDPIANLVAGINYIKGTYGSVANTPGIKSLMSGGAYKGYFTGTTFATAGKKLVGEHGAEVVDFKGGETVHNANDTEKMLNEKSITQNVYITSPKALSASEIARQNKRALRELGLQLQF